METSRSTKNTHILHDFMREVATTAAFGGSEAKEKSRLAIEREYRKSDDILSSLIEQQSKELTDSAQTFTQVVGKLKRMKEASDHVRSWLIFSKDHLKARQDDLKTLWMQTVELQEELKLVDSIEKVKRYPSEIEEALEEEQFEVATDAIVEGVKLTSGKLHDVDALSNLRVVFNDRRTALTRLMEDCLDSYLYVQCVQPALLKLSGRRENQSGSNLPNVELPVIVRCLFDLGELSSALKDIYHTLSEKLQQVFLHTTETIHAVHYVELLQNQNRPELLEKLIEILVEEMKAIAEAHQSLLAEVEKIRNSAGTEPSVAKRLHVYEMSDVWLAMEGIMQRVLDHYLTEKTAKSIANDESNSSSFTEKIRSSWTRRRPKKIMGLSFRFDKSSSAQVLNEYAAEERRKRFMDGGGPAGGYFGEGNNGSSELKTICAPAMKNVTLVYVPIMKLCETIDRTLNSGKPCVLSIHIDQFVAETYLPSLETLSVEKARACGRDESLKMAPPAVLKALGEPDCKILLNFYQCQRQVEDLCDLILTMPTHSERIANVAAKCIEEFTAGTEAAFHKTTAYLPGTESPESVRWSADEQFCMFYRTLPGWFYRKEAVPVNQSLSELDILLKMYDGSAEVMSDSKVFRYIALFMENCEWLHGMLERSIHSVPYTTIKAGQELSVLEKKSASLNMSSETAKKLREKISVLMELTERSFLIVHWEIRIRCLYQLGKPLIFSKMDWTLPDVGEEIERRVAALVGDLLNISRLLGSVVDGRKFSFFFKGLGSLFCAIFMRNVDQMVKINAKAVQVLKRCLFHLDETLTQITRIKDPVFESARTYFEMFLAARKPGDMIMQIVQNGAIFTVKEYEAAIRLVHRSYQEDQRKKSDAGQAKPGEGPVWTVDEEIDRLRMLFSSMGTSR